MAELTGVYTVLLRDLLLVRKKWLGFVAGNMVGPLLYLMAFGWGLGRNIQFGGASYLDFVVPGIVALSAMNGSYNATGTALNISRLYHRSLEEFLTAPVSICSIVLGYVLSGCAHGLFSAAAILILSYFFGAHLHYGTWFFITLFLTCFLFAALGVVAGTGRRSGHTWRRWRYNRNWYPKALKPIVATWRRRSTTWAPYTAKPADTRMQSWHTWIPCSLTCLIDA